MPVKNKYNKYKSAFEQVIMVRDLMQRTDIKDTEKLIIQAIIDAYNANTRQCNPSAKDIGKRINKSQSTVMKYLKAAQNYGYIHRTSRGNVGRSNTYEYNRVLLKQLMDEMEAKKKNKNSNKVENFSPMPNQKDTSTEIDIAPMPNKTDTCSEMDIAPIPDKEVTYTKFRTSPVPIDQHEDSKEDRNEGIKEESNLRYQQKDTHKGKEKFYEFFGDIINRTPS